MSNRRAWGLFNRVDAPPAAPYAFPVITRVGRAGMLVVEPRHPGETRADRAAPSHPSALRLSRDVWMLLFGTRKFTGVDDDRSIFCQLRRGGVDGPVIRERILAAEREDWDPFAEGDRLCKVHGTPTAFGVPKGALLGGRPALNANVFVAKWYTYPKRRVEGRNANVLNDHAASEDSARRVPERLRRYLRIEGIQFRLNEAEDDLEVLHGPRILQQRGFEGSDLPCEGAEGGMNHSMMPPRPADAACREWMGVDHFGGNFKNARLAAVLYRFDAATGLYEWVRTGPLTPDLGNEPLFEATLDRLGEDWVVCARSNRDHGQTAWFRVEDPLRGWTKPVFRETPQAWAPRSASVCADGVLRVFGNDFASSPRGDERNPLCCWDVDPGTFQASNRRVLFDSRSAGLPLRLPYVDAPRLLRAGPGREVVGFRVLTPCKWHAVPNCPPLTPEEFRACGQYAAELQYDIPVAEPWDFGSPSQTCSSNLNPTPSP